MFDRLWGFLRDHLIADTVVIVSLMATVIAVLGWEGDWRSTLRGILMALLTTAFATCFLGLVFQRSNLDKAIGRGSVQAVLETIFVPESRLYDVVSRQDLMRISHVAAAAANGIRTGDDRFGLVEACLAEVEERLRMPHREVSIFRTCVFDPRFPDVVLVREVSKTNYVNRGEAAVHNQSEWRSVRSIALAEGALVPAGVDTMVVKTRMLDEVGSRANPGFPQTERIACRVNAGMRIWNNPASGRFTVPAGCENMRVETERSFYLSVADNSIEYTWPAPIRSLDYRVAFEGRRALFFPTIVGCSKCSEPGPCATCGKPEISLNAGERADINIRDWTGSQAHLAITWSFMDEGRLEAATTAPFRSGSRQGTMSPAAGPYDPSLV